MLLLNGIYMEYYSLFSPLSEMQPVIFDGVFVLHGAVGI